MLTLKACPTICLEAFKVLIELSLAGHRGQCGVTKLLQASACTESRPYDRSHRAVAAKTT
jgi:hypothetical protein